MPLRMPLSGSFICQLCRRSTRPTQQFRPISISSRRPAKAREIDDFYALLLDQPLKTSAVAKRPLYSTPSKNLAASPSTSLSSKSAKSKGTSLATSKSSEKPGEDVQTRSPFSTLRVDLEGDSGREARRAERDAAAEVIAGIRIPPRPDEPDNCCMSGCVNCVWDLYREELEEWAALKQKAAMRVRGSQTAATGTGRQQIVGGGMTEGQISMDDDGGGAETNWGNGHDPLNVNVRTSEGTPKKPIGGLDALFDDIPVGLREFMKTEKRLNAKKREAKKAASVL